MGFMSKIKNILFEEEEIEEPVKKEEIVEKPIVKKEVVKEEVMDFDYQRPVETKATHSVDD